MRHALIMLAVLLIAPPAVAQSTFPHPKIELLGAPTDWSARDIAAFAAGAASMPEALLDRLDAPIRMRRVHQACLSGIGRETQRCPTYDRDGAFLIFDMPPLQGEGRVQRLQQLNVEEREELQRRRAVVHAVMLANDRVERWSKQPAWRRINGWRASAQPFNRDSWGYSRYLGVRSAQLDFVTFAEEWFVRPEDVIAPLRRDRLAPDDDVECDAMSQHRFLSTLVARLAPTWSPNRRRAVPHCPAFEAWARQHDLAAVEVVLAEASTASPQSMYGHLLLQLRYDAAADRVYEFRPVTGTPIAPLTMASRALLGGFHTVLEQRTAEVVRREFQQREQRDLRRYTLRLTPPQTRRLLERIWEVERHHRLPFQFFVNNCASFLLDLIEPALHVDVDAPALASAGLVVTPTDVVEVLDAANLLGAPRVDFAPRAVAEASIAPRRALGARLGEVLGVAPRQARELKRIVAQVEDRKAVTRYLAYNDLQQLLLVQLQRRRNDDVLEVVLEYLQRSIAIEQYYADVADTRARATLPRPPRSVEEILAARRAADDASEVADPPIPNAADLTSRQLLALNHADEAEFALRAAIEARDAVTERFAPKFDLAAYDAARRRVDAEKQVARDARTSSASGRSHLSLGGSLASDGRVMFGAVDVRAAALAETLGTQRQGGFRPSVELYVLELSLHVPVRPQFWELLDVDLTLLRFLTTERKLPAVRRSAWGVLGWGGEVFAGHDGRRGVDLEGGAAGGVVWPIVQRDQSANIVLAGLYTDARVQLGDQGRRLIAGGEAFVRLRLHLGGAYRNALQLRVATRHGVAVESLQHVWSHHGRVATEHRLATLGRRELIASPWVVGEWTNVDDTGRDAFLDVRLGASLNLAL